MLARRFAIVCLMVTLFGMGLSSLVAQDGRIGRAGAQDCGFSSTYRCAPSWR